MTAPCGFILRLGYPTAPRDQMESKPKVARPRAFARIVHQLAALVWPTMALRVRTAWHRGLLGPLRGTQFMPARKGCFANAYAWSKRGCACLVAPRSAQCHSATHQRDGGFNNRRSDPERATQATGDSSLGCPYESRSKLDEAGRETSRLALLLSEL